MMLILADHYPSPSPLGSSHFPMIHTAASDYSHYYSHHAFSVIFLETTTTLMPIWVYFSFPVAGFVSLSSWVAKDSKKPNHSRQECVMAANVLDDGATQGRRPSFFYFIFSIGCIQTRNWYCLIKYSTMKRTWHSSIIHTNPPTFESNEINDEFAAHIQSADVLYTATLLYIAQ